jgi:DNA polymerase
MILYLDLETYSAIPIREGTYKYAANSEVMIVTWACDDGAVHAVDLTGKQESLEEVIGLIREATKVVIHNSMFDRNVLAAQGIIVPVEKIHDTMVQAYLHGLPGSLGKLCEIFNLQDDSKKDGGALINLFCKPRPKNQKLRRATRDTHPREWAEFIEYAVADIVATRSLYKKMPRWNCTDRESALWRADQRINDRGFCVDVALACGAVRAVDAYARILKAGTAESKSGLYVPSTTQGDKLLTHLLAEHHVSLPDLRAATIEKRLNDPELTDAVKELLRVRLESTTTSTSKYKALTKGVSKDGRLRGTSQFCGAFRTGRWAHRGFQPGNLPRPDMKQKEIDIGIQCLLQGGVDLAFANPMRVASNAIRGCIIAPEGKKLVIADLANIEGRVAAWLAGEDWKLDAFREYDAGRGPDLYIVAYAAAFQMLAEKVSKKQRQVGKVMELMLQYEGGVGAFLTGAATYGIDLEELAAAAKPSIPADVWAEASAFWDWCIETKRNTYGLPRETHMVCESLKRMWRRRHPGITSTWKAIKQAVVDVVTGVWESVEVGPLTITKEGPWLRIQLPSGRHLCYPAIRWHEEKLSYMGQNQYTRKWERLSTYSGKMFENIVQAVSRDILGEGIMNAEAAGFKVLLTIHDELLTETVIGTVDELCKLMCAVSPAYDGLPLAAAGFETQRYRKE